MIDQLRKIFSTLILYQDITENEKDNYRWFMTMDSELIGVHQKELTGKDVQLLSTFLRPHNIFTPAITPEEKAWHT
ncbi:hypothetical protein [Lentibacillus sp. CBA3610]|uniref:hypothetical protein n=1 Tax=Lentibacillus sp. CBA3610 TaxID=2518176 RepID=UPI0015952CC4|nr:hypothetical protein [Lentibacillus sp. CBA3610]QKY68502.1 hypothetical protein Len3610_01690 [Lentibacillus sp. CBA3610]